WSSERSSQLLITHPGIHVGQTTGVKQSYPP
ncbi:hypothetical protein X975_22275, partial [Stegodyphus mimosarum]